jgi:oxalate decarboxylase/phosphoglucose isomerase-like protein (cupin superfamily)
MRGQAMMTIFGQGIDTFELDPGEVIFIPSAYFHCIEN